MGQTTHVLTQIDWEQKTAMCAVCGAVRVYAATGGRKRADGSVWVCGRLPAKRGVATTDRSAEGRKTRMGRKMLHGLSAIDPEAQTATCETCGPVRIYKAQGKRARIGQEWCCGRRPATRKVGGKIKHRLTDVNEETQTATCANCGHVKIFWREFSASGGRWGCIYTRHSANLGSYKPKDGYKRVICPFCKVYHRWDRDQGRTCREKLVERYGNECNICGESFDEAPRIDHDHSTGEVRGLLCMKCNAGIGYLQDSPEILNSARTYLLARR